MIINLYKHRIIIALIVVLMASIPLIFKYDKEQKQITKKEVKKSTLHGEFLPWDEVNRIFPKYAKAYIIDFDSHLKFKVQRRGGTNHADIQPLTANDTSTMKKIYNGQWSWKRKAVILELDNGKKIAASINGMPHGQGAIKGNNFYGHFCIHFRDSKTHGSNSLNLSHQIMVWKSADVVDQQLLNLDQEKIIDVFFTAIDQGEIKIAQKIIGPGKKVDRLLKSLAAIRYIRINQIEKEKGNSYKVDLGLLIKDSNKEIRRVMVINLLKGKSGWRISPQSLTPLENI